jgi:hypothetical protein
VLSEIERDQTDPGCLVVWFVGFIMRLFILRSGGRKIVGMEGNRWIGGMEGWRGG